MTHWPPPPEGQPPYGQQPHYGQPHYPPPGYPPPAYGYPAPPPVPPYGWGPPPAPVPGGRNASMGARFAGLVLDTLVISGVSFVLGVTAGFGGPGLEALTELVVVVFSLAYYGVLVGLRGQSVGHMAAGIRVVRLSTGQPIGFWRAIGRQVILSLSGALCTLGYWTPFFDSLRRQGWHDKVVDAVVIPAAPHVP